jgi:hypothetical protein
MLVGSHQPGSPTKSKRSRRGEILRPGTKYSGMFEYWPEPWEVIEEIYAAPNVRVIIQGAEPTCTILVMLDFLHANDHNDHETWRFCGPIGGNYPKRAEAKQFGLEWLRERIKCEPCFG